MRSRLASRVFLASAGVLWLAAVVLGFVVMLRDQANAGPPASPPALWPQDCGLARSAKQPTLLVFAHPQCPCTRATIGELDRIAARCVGRMHIAVLFLSLPELGDAWNHSATWEAASAIPGVEVRADRDGALARRFGVVTSGQALLYDAAGKLVFQGGVTAARGHAGDNLGEDSVVALATGQPPERCASSVFGCRLYPSDPRAKP
jgi:hypothetical protein